MRPLTYISILLLLVTAVPPQAGPPVTDTRLEGRVMASDGRPATGYRVHLIDGAGEDAVLAAVDDEGAYRMHGLEPGRYSLALETPEGLYAPVNGPGVRVRDGHLVQRDLKLVERDPAQPGGHVYESTQFGSWWAGLDNGARAWTIVALVVVAGITAEALSSDETPASEIDPPT